MPDLVTIEDAYEHLRIDYDTGGSADDRWLRMAIPAVSQAVLLWLKDPWRACVRLLDTSGTPILDSNGDPVLALDSNGDPIVLPVVQLAVLAELESQYRFRGGEGKDNVVSSDAGYGYVLNKASTALLAPLRRPTVA